MTDISTPAVANGNGGAVVQRSAFATKQLDLWNLARSLANSDLIPKQFAGKPSNVFLAIQMAERMDLDLFAVMSNLLVVHGTPAFSSKFLIGLANMRGPFRGPLRFKTTEKPLAVTCYATLRDSGEDVSVTVSIAQAETAGWTANKKYKEIPAQMLSYRAATFLVRLYCPEVALMGARTVDEVEDMHAAGVGPSADFRDVEPIKRDPLSQELHGATAASSASEAVAEATARATAATSKKETTAPGAAPRGGIGEGESVGRTAGDPAGARERSSEAPATSPGPAERALFPDAQERDDEG